MTPLTSTSELAARLGLAEITLRKWRIYGIGPRFVKVGANVRYRAEDVEHWIASRSAVSTSETLPSVRPLGRCSSGRA
jgi:hypothetical protein